MTGSQDLRERLRMREPLFAAWTSLGHPSITEAFTRSGVDFIGIDLEHSTISLEQAREIIAAAQAGGIPCLPRAASHKGDEIRRLLDSGADGIIVPNVTSTAQADEIVRWCKYPPLGNRSYGVARAHSYGFDFDRYVRDWNDRSVLLIQIESIAGVENAQALVSLPHVDGVLLGPYDISGSLGLPGKLSDPKVTEACSRVIGVCRKYGKACGTQIVDPNRENVQAALAQGCTFVVLASDVFLLWKWGERQRALLATLRETAALSIEDRDA